MKKVLIPTKLDTVAADILTANGNYTVVQDDTTPLPELASANSDTYAIIVRSDKVTAEVIDLLPDLKVVVRAGAGFNTIDTEHARQKGVDVMNTPGANANAVAEEVVAMMLADVRHIVSADNSIRQGKWEKKSLMGREITGKTVGIIGLGAIGQLVAKRLSGFDVTLIGFDPIVSAEQAKEFNVLFKSVEDIFREADFVTLHVPENDATRNMVGENLLSLMKSGATVINCARSGIVDEQALRDAKASNGIRFLNDVYDKDAEGDKSVADFADLMLPHLGASTVEAGFNAATRAAEEIIEFDEQGITTFIVNA